jgi:hypothetical protein
MIAGICGSISTDPISFFLDRKKNGKKESRAGTEVFHQRIGPNPDGVHVAACDD